MLRYVVKRAALMIVTLFIIISITFFISKLLPGTPFADEKLTPQLRQVLFEKYGLDEPIYVQYAKYMLNVAQGDLGNSFYYEGRPVLDMILARAPVSAFIGIQAVILGFIAGLMLGIIAALRHNTWWDTLAVVVAVLGVGVPSFVLGPILQVNDYSMILGTTIFFSATFIVALLIQDILYGIIDPRIRVAGAKE
jgi:oligopeptide transport system permease protein